MGGVGVGKRSTVIELGASGETEGSENVMTIQGKASLPSKLLLQSPKMPLRQSSGVSEIHVAQT